MALSPDGETLAVVQGGTTLWLVGVDGTRRQVDLGPDVVPGSATLRWSGDGRHLAVEVQSSTGQSGGTDLVSADGARLVRLDGASNPTWSPDGRWVAVVARHDRTRGIDVANADGTGRVAVTGDPVKRADDLAWVPRP